MRTAQAENLAMSRTTRTVTIDSSMRACINCQHYEPYYRDGRGNISWRVTTPKGYCVLHEQERGALRQPCKDFLKQMERR